jgi:hypothetical protein
MKQQKTVTHFQTDNKCTIRLIGGSEKNTTSIVGDYRFYMTGAMIVRNS